METNKKDKKKQRRRKSCSPFSCCFRGSETDDFDDIQDRLQERAQSVNADSRVKEADVSKSTSEFLALPFRDIEKRDTKSEEKDSQSKKQVTPKILKNRKTEHENVSIFQTLKSKFSLQRRKKEQQAQSLVWHYHPREDILPAKFQLPIVRNPPDKSTNTPARRESVKDYMDPVRRSVECMRADVKLSQRSNDCKNPSSTLPRIICKLEKTTNKSTQTTNQLLQIRNVCDKTPQDFGQNSAEWAQTQKCSEQGMNKCSQASSELVHSTKKYEQTLNELVERVNGCTQTLNVLVNGCTETLNVLVDKTKESAQMPIRSMQVTNVCTQTSNDCLNSEYEHTQMRNQLVKRANGWTQTSTDLISRRNGSTQTSTSSLQRTNGCTQTSGDLVQRSDGCTQTSSDLVQISNGCTQTSCDLVQTSIGCTQTSSELMQRSDGCTQTLSDLVQRSNGCTQTLCDLVKRSNGCTQTSSELMQRSDGCTQTLCDLVQRSNGCTQTYDGMAQRSNGCIQTSTDLVQRSDGCTQTSSDLVQMLNGCTQTSIDLVQMSNGCTQTGMNSLQNGWTQTHIISLQRKNGCTQTSIGLVQTTNGCTQTCSDLTLRVNGYPNLPVQKVNGCSQTLNDLVQSANACTQTLLELIDIQNEYTESQRKPIQQQSVSESSHDSSKPKESNIMSDSAARLSQNSTQRAATPTQRSNGSLHKSAESSQWSSESSKTSGKSVQKCIQDSQTANQFEKNEGRASVSSLKRSEHAQRGNGFLQKTSKSAEMSMDSSKKLTEFSQCSDESAKTDCKSAQKSNEHSERRNELEEKAQETSVSSPERNVCSQTDNISSQKASNCVVKCRDSSKKSTESSQTTTESARTDSKSIQRSIEHSQRSNASSQKSGKIVLRGNKSAQKPSNFSKKTIEPSQTADKSSHRASQDEQSTTELSQRASKSLQKTSKSSKRSDEFLPCSNETLIGTPEVAVTTSKSSEKANESHKIPESAQKGSGSARQLSTSSGSAIVSCQKSSKSSLTASKSLREAHESGMVLRKCLAGSGSKSESSLGSRKFKKERSSSQITTENMARKSESVRGSDNSLQRVSESYHKSCMSAERQSKSKPVLSEHAQKSTESRKISKTKQSVDHPDSVNSDNQSVSEHKIRKNTRQNTGTPLPTDYESELVPRVLEDHQAVNTKQDLKSVLPEPSDGQSVSQSSNNKQIKNEEQDIKPCLFIVNEKQLIPEMSEDKQAKNVEQSDKPADSKRRSVPRISKNKKPKSVRKNIKSGLRGQPSVPRVPQNKKGKKGKQNKQKQPLQSEDSDTLDDIDSFCSDIALDLDTNDFVTVEASSDTISVAVQQNVDESNKVIENDIDMCGSKEVADVGHRQNSSEQVETPGYKSFEALPGACVTDVKIVANKFIASPKEKRPVVKKVTFREKLASIIFIERDMDYSEFDETEGYEHALESEPVEMQDMTADDATRAIRDLVDFLKVTEESAKDDIHQPEDLQLDEKTVPQPPLPQDGNTATKNGGSERPPLDVPVFHDKRMSSSSSEDLEVYDSERELCRLAGTERRRNQDGGVKSHSDLSCDLSADFEFSYESSREAINGQNNQNEGVESQVFHKTTGENKFIPSPPNSSSSGRSNLRMNKYTSKGQSVKAVSPEPKNGLPNTSSVLPSGTAELQEECDTTSSDPKEAESKSGNVQTGLMFSSGPSEADGAPKKEGSERQSPDALVIHDKPITNSNSEDIDTYDSKGEICRGTRTDKSRNRGTDYRARSPSDLSCDLPANVEFSYESSPDATDGNNKQNKSGDGQVLDETTGENKFIPSPPNSSSSGRSKLRMNKYTSKRQSVKAVSPEPKNGLPNTSSVLPSGTAEFQEDHITSLASLKQAELPRDVQTESMFSSEPNEADEDGAPKKEGSERQPPDVPVFHNKPKSNSSSEDLEVYNFNGELCRLSGTDRRRNQDTDGRARSPSDLICDLPANYEFSYESSPEATDGQNKQHEGVDCQVSNKRSDEIKPLPAPETHSQLMPSPPNSSSSVRPNLRMKNYTPKEESELVSPEPINGLRNISSVLQSVTATLQEEQNISSASFQQSRQDEGDSPKNESSERQPPDVPTLHVKPKSSSSSEELDIYDSWGEIRRPSGTGSRRNRTSRVRSPSDVSSDLSADFRFSYKFSPEASSGQKHNESLNGQGSDKVPEHSDLQLVPSPPNSSSSGRPKLKINQFTSKGQCVKDVSPGPNTLSTNDNIGPGSEQADFIVDLKQFISDMQTFSLPTAKKAMTSHENQTHKLGASSFVLRPIEQSGIPIDPKLPRPSGKTPNASGLHFDDPLKDKSDPASVASEEEIFPGRNHMPVDKQRDVTREEPQIPCQQNEEDNISSKTTVLKPTSSLPAPFPRPDLLAPSLFRRRTDKGLPPVMGRPMSAAGALLASLTTPTAKETRQQRKAWPSVDRPVSTEYPARWDPRQHSTEFDSHLNYAEPSPNSSGIRSHNPNEQFHDSSLQMQTLRRGSTPQSKFDRQFKSAMDTSPELPNQTRLESQIIPPTDNRQASTVTVTAKQRRFLPEHKQTDQRWASTQRDSLPQPEFGRQIEESNPQLDSMRRGSLQQSVVVSHNDAREDKLNTQNVVQIPRKLDSFQKQSNKQSLPAADALPDPQLGSRTRGFWQQPKAVTHTEEAVETLPSQNMTQIPRGINLLQRRFSQQPVSTVDAQQDTSPTLHARDRDSYRGTSEAKDTMTVGHRFTRPVSSEPQEVEPLGASGREKDETKRSTRPAQTPHRFPDKPMLKRGKLQPPKKNF